MYVLSIVLSILIMILLMQATTKTKQQTALYVRASVAAVAASTVRAAAVSDLAAVRLSLDVFLTQTPANMRVLVVRIVLLLVVLLLVPLSELIMEEAHQPAHSPLTFHSPSNHRMKHLKLPGYQDTKKLSGEWEVLL